MIRKTILTIATVAAVGAAALVPTSQAFAGGGKWKGKHWHHGHFGFHIVVGAYDDDCGWKWFRKYGRWYKVYVCD
jgi:hypothetical protein